MHDYINDLHLSLTHLKISCNRASISDRSSGEFKTGRRSLRYIMSAEICLALFSVKTKILIFSRKYFSRSFNNIKTGEWISSLREEKIKIRFENRRSKSEKGLAFPFESFCFGICTRIEDDKVRLSGIKRLNSEINDLISDNSDVTTGRNSMGISSCSTNSLLSRLLNKTLKFHTI